MILFTYQERGGLWETMILAKSPVSNGITAIGMLVSMFFRVQEAIRLGESEGKSFYEITEASQAFGWRTFDFSCLEAYEQGKITEDTAMLYCTKRGPVMRGIDNIKKARGESTTSMGSLRMKALQEAARSNTPQVPVTLKLK